MHYQIHHNFDHACLLTAQKYNVGRPKVCPPVLCLNIKIDKNIFFQRQISKSHDRESVASSVIQATVMVEFEDGLTMGVLPGECWGP